MPSEPPPQTNAAASPRRAGGIASTASASVSVTATPEPAPTTKRSTPSVHTSLAKPQATIAPHMIASAIALTLLRSVRRARRVAARVPAR